MPAGISNASFSTVVSTLNAHKVLTGQTILYETGLANNSTVTIHTVTAGKTFYLLAAGMSCKGTLSLELFYLFKTNNGSPILKMISATDALQTIWSDTTTITFPLPIPIVAGTVIGCQATGAGSQTNGWIIGWEE